MFDKTLQSIWLEYYECASHALNSIDTPDDNMPISETDKSPVSLNGNCFGLLIISRLVSI